jgi:hypothetical protein
LPAFFVFAGPITGLVDAEIALKRLGFAVSGKKDTAAISQCRMSV